MSGKRSFFDENYLKSISETNSENKLLHILDAVTYYLYKQYLVCKIITIKLIFFLKLKRPYINALANCTTGGGYENEKYYTSSKISFLNIENIHTMR